MTAHGGTVGSDSLAIVLEEPRALPPEVFTVAGIAGLWDPSWRLSGAAIGTRVKGCVSRVAPRSRRPAAW